MRTFGTLPLAALSLVLGHPSWLSAQPLLFQDQSLWQASFSRPPDVVETFDGFRQDTSFRAAPLHLTNGFTLTTVGRHENPFDQVIDVPPFGSPVFPVNGTPFGQAFTNIADVGGGAGDIALRLDFDNAVPGWGLQLNLPLDASGEGLGISLHLANGGTTAPYVVSPGPASGYQGFIGFMSDLPITGATFAPLVPSTGFAGTRIGFDNVMVYVPEPVTCWIVLAPSAVALIRPRPSTRGRGPRRGQNGVGKRDVSNTSPLSPSAS